MNTYKVRDGGPCVQNNWVGVVDVYFVPTQGACSENNHIFLAWDGSLYGESNALENCGPNRTACNKRGNIQIR